MEAGATAALAAERYAFTDYSPVACLVSPASAWADSSNRRNEIVALWSNHSVDETVATIEDLPRAGNVKPFTVIDHSGEAEKADMNMPPMKLFIFGSPKAGTP